MLLATVIFSLAFLQPDSIKMDESHPAAWDLTSGDLAAPHGVAALPDGRILVTEPHAHRIAVINSNGSRQNNWGEYGINWGQLYRPAGIDSDGVDTTVVADAGNHRIQLLDKNGVTQGVLTDWNDVPFRNPQDVALSTTWMAIADTGNDRVCVLNRDQVGHWCVNSDISLKSPQGVDVDDEGALCIADTGNHRILIFNPDGSLRSEFGDWGRFPGLFAEPTGVEFNGEHVYVVDRLNHRVQVFTRDGEPVTWWGMHAVVPRQGEGNIHYPCDIAVMPDGQRAVVSEPFERRVQFFKPGPPSRPAASKTRAPQGLQSHFGHQVATGGRGLVTWEPEVRSLAVFVTDLKVPIHVTTFGTPGDSTGQIGDIADLSWDEASDALTIIDHGNNTIQRWRITLPPSDALRYDPNAAVLLDSKTMPDIREGRRLVPVSVVHDAAGRLHAIDESLDRVVTFHQGDMTEWELDIDPVALGTDGISIAVADGRTGSVHVFDQVGNTGSMPGSKARIIGPAPDLLHPWPGGVAILNDGTIAISDTAMDRIDHFSADGTHLATYSEPGGDHGQLWMPGEIGQDAMGRLVVLDHGNHRMQAFEPDTGWVLTFGLGRSMTPDRLPRSSKP